MKNNMVKIKVVSGIQDSFGKTDTVEEYMWVNLDHVIAYHEPSCGLVLANNERIVVAYNEKGHSVLVDALNGMKVKERE
jgi:hypothetical protein